MTLGRFLTMSVLAAVASVASSSATLAQSHPGFVQLGRVSAAIYMPDSGPAPHVAFLIAHRTANNLNNSACKELSGRGFMVLCFNTRFVNNELEINYDELVFDVKTAMDFVRSRPGITRVILLGHSGGSPMMGYYQAVAENGASYCQGPNKLMPCHDSIAEDLTPADGMFFPDAHPGNGEQALHGFNPSLKIVEGKVVVVDPLVDPFSEANGYDPNGPSHYSDEFRERYYLAQSRVMNAKIAEVEALRDRIARGEGTFPDNDIVLVPFDAQAGAARLDLLDPTVREFSITHQPRKFLRNDGTIVMQIARSVKAPRPQQAQINRTFDGGVKVLSITSFLSANAIRSNHAIRDVDHCSTNASTVCAVQHIHAPILIAAMGAYNHIRWQEIMYELSPAHDKDYIVIEGALHGYTPCTACEVSPGQYSNTSRNLFNYVADWVNTRF